MGVAKTRLVRDLTIKQMVQNLAVGWRDDNEWKVLELIGGLLENHNARHNDLLACFRLDVEAAGEEPAKTVELKAGDIGGHLRRMATNAKALEDTEAKIDWDDPKAQITVYVEELHHPNVDTPLLHQICQLLPKAPGPLNQFLAPVGEVSVRKESVIQALRDKGFPVPGTWIGKGLTQSGQSRGGRANKKKKGLVEVIKWIGEKIEAEGQRLNPSTFRSWLQENVDSDLDTPIPECDDLYFVDDILSWKDSSGKHHELTFRSLEPYIRDAKNQD